MAEGCGGCIGGCFLLTLLGFAIVGAFVLFGGMAILVAIFGGAG